MAWDIGADEFGSTTEVVGTVTGVSATAAIGTVTGATDSTGVWDIGADQYSPDAIPRRERNITNSRAIPLFRASTW